MVLMSLLHNSLSEVLILNNDQILRISESRFLEDSPWAWEFRMSKLRFCSSQPL